MAVLSHEVCLKSDHLALCLDLNYDRDSRPRPFRFLTTWLRDKSCKEVIMKPQSTNVNRSNAYQLIQKLRLVQKSLRKWNKDHSGFYHHKLKQLHMELEFTLSSLALEENWEHEKIIRRNIEEPLKRQERIWFLKIT